VQGADETAAVIASARDAIGRGQHEQAEQLLRGIWDTTRSDDAQLAEASYQMGRALLGQSRGVEAKEYADWAAQQGHPDAGALQAEIGEILGGLKAAADGVQVAEQRGVFEAAQTAYAAGDYAGALELYVAVYDSPTLPPRQKGGCAFNIAQCHRFLGSYEMSRSWFEEYLRLSPDSEYAAEVAGNLDRIEDLVHLTAAIPLE
jgi:tetratricopeptide (TPR) repeat protein